MKVDRYAIAAIRAKVWRSQHHLESIGREVVAFNRAEPSPYRLQSKMYAGGGKHVFYLHINREFPPEWGVAFGEAIHDIRSALDHTVYQLTIDWRGRRLSNTGFPVFRQRADFRRHSSLIRGIGPGPQAFIEKLQPYPHRRRVEHRALRLVHDRWNQDKHRVVHPTGVELRRVEVYHPPGCTFEVNGRVLQDGARAVTIVCDPPNPDVNMHVEAEAKVVIHDPSRMTRGLSESWHGYLGTIGTVVERLLGSIGQQADPIPF